MRSYRPLAAIGAIVLSALVQADGARAQSRPALLGTVEGVVLSKKGGEPLAGAIASWSRSGAQTPGDTAVQGETDELGRFAFAIPIVGNTDVNTIRVSVDANGYDSKKATVKVRDGEITQIEVRLASKPEAKIGMVTGTVTNARTGQVIEGAEVSIVNAGAVLEAVTDARGTYTIPGVGFQSSLQIRMITPREGDTDEDSPTPCLVPTQRTFSMDQPIVTEDFASVPAVTFSPECPTAIVGSPPGESKTSTKEMAELPNDASLQWQQADSFSILTDGAGPDAWNSGHINSIVQLDGTEGFLVGSDTGGVWAIASNQQAIPLSFGWDSINISSMAAGVRNGHFYAATYPGGDHSANATAALWETDTDSIVPLLDWYRVPTPSQCGTINKVLVVPEVNDIVLACDFTLWWSPIPPAPHGSYGWNHALFENGAPLDINFSGLAKGPTIAGTGEASIVAILYGGDAPAQLIYQGRWVSGDLQLFSASVEGPAAHFERASIASCSANLNVQYAIAAAADNDHLGGVWRSIDGGATWQARTVTDVGNRGWYNQDVAVSPADCNIMAIGWRNDGPYLSFDGGGSYKQITGGEHHQHSDLHALLFDRNDPNTIYVGSDGGLLAVGNITGTPTFQSNLNRGVLDMQVYHAVGSTRQKHLVVVSLQDNGTDDSLLAPVGSGGWDQLVELDGGDGWGSEFVTPVSLPQGHDILIRGEANSPWVSQLWNGTSFDDPPKRIPVATPTNPRDNTGIPRGPVTRVRFPHFANDAGQLMYAAAGVGDKVVGLFANDDGGDLHWELLGFVGVSDTVTSLSSFDGTTLFVGTDHTHIYRIDQPYIFNPTTLLPVTNGPSMGGKVTSIAEFIPTIAFATLDSGHVLGWQGQTWNALGGGTLPTSQPFNAVLLPDLNDLIAMSPTSVYISHDSGATWATASSGLPAINQGEDLRYVIEPDNTQVIYMATYGRSVWRTVFRP